MEIVILGSDLVAAGGQYHPSRGYRSDRGDRSGRAGRRRTGALVARPIAILAYNCIVTTAVGYFLWGKVLAMMPAATAGQVLTLTPIGGFVLSTLIFGGTISADAVISIVLIVGGIFITLRR